MARKLPKRYKPGELDAVRKKIGYVSPEEAKHLTGVLGGEIGIEKSDFDLQRERLQAGDSGKRKKNVDVIESMQDGSYQKFQMISKQPNSIENELTVLPAKKNLSYFDRVKIDFLCSKPEFGIKSLASAVGSLLSFIFPVPDNVNPGFINALEKSVLKPIVDLVKATRALYTKTREEIYNHISTNSFYAGILKIFKNWDIESLELEIFHLKKAAKGQNMRNLLRLCKMVYYPIMLLSQLDEIRQILTAYKWAYNINIKSASTQLKDKERLISLYYDAEKNLPYVLNNLKKLLYPFLLKRVAAKFYNYEEFFITEQENVFNFLGIYPGDLPDNDLRTAPGELADEDEDSGKSAEIKEEEPAAAAVTAGLPETVQKGVNCLEKLYPKAGWYNLDKFPDFYSYFQPIFNYQDGFKLIPPTDPLHQLTILLSILNDLFYGFRNIKFGLLRDKDMEAYNIQGQVEGLINSWPLYIDEIISKVYISRLTDYCRQMEKDKSFKMSEVGKKIITEMDWIKKNYLLPYLALKLHTQIAGIIKRQLPKLSELTMSLKDLLTQVVDELKHKTEEGTKAKFESINNPWSPYIFDLENNTSRNLSKLLYIKTVDAGGNNKIIDRRNNANLLFYTVSILTLLDYLINNKESHFYYSPSSKVFRSIHTESDIPQYSVPVNTPVANPADFIEEGIEPAETHKAASQFSLKDAIDRKILQSRKNGTIFTVVYLNFIPGSEPDAVIINAHIQKEIDFVIPFLEDSLLILYENRDTKNAIMLVKNLVKEIGKEKLAAGIIQYQLDWSFGYFQKILEKIRLFTAKQGVSRIVYLDLAHNKFRSIIV